MCFLTCYQGHLCVKMLMGEVKIMWVRDWLTILIELSVGHLQLWVRYQCLIFLSDVICYSGDENGLGGVKVIIET